MVLLQGPTGWRFVMGKVLLQDGVLLWARCSYRMALFYGQGAPEGEKRAAGEHTGCMRRTIKYNCFAVMRSSSEEGSNLRLVDFVYHSTLGRE